MIPAPIVSVLLPARNAATTLGAALNSVRAQSFSDFEIVLVDDGSTDDTGAIARSFALADSRLRIRTTGGLGIVRALNTGLDACRGRFVARFDADDLMHRHRLELQVEALERDPTLAGVGCLVRSFPRHSLRDGMRRYETWLNSTHEPHEVARERFIESPLVHPSVTLRRDVLLRVQGWRDPEWAEDWDLWLRLFESGASLAKVPKVLHFWRDHPVRLTRTHPRYSAQAFMRCRAHYLARGPLRNRPAVVWGAGPVGKALVKALDAEGATVMAYVDIDPRKIGQRIHGRPVLQPDDMPSPIAALSTRPLTSTRALTSPRTLTSTRPLTPTSSLVTSTGSDGVVLLAAVGAAGARDDIRAEALSRGFREGESFFACA